MIKKNTNERQSIDTNLYLPLCSGWNAECYRINNKNLEEQDNQTLNGFFIVYSAW
jgi:hypothetical protein